MVFAVIIGAWFIFIGIYSFYYASSMKKSGSIKAGWMVSRDIQLTDCKDIPGYIEYVYPKTMIFAVLVVVFGLSMVIAESVKVHAVSAFSILALGVIYIWYSTFMSGAQKKYLTRNLKKRTKKF